jgi:hypothetical protein
VSTDTTVIDRLDAVGYRRHYYDVETEVIGNRVRTSFRIDIAGASANALLEAIGDLPGVVASGSNRDPRRLPDTGIGSTAAWIEREVR